MRFPTKIGVPRSSACSGLSTWAPISPTVAIHPKRKARREASARKATDQIRQLALSTGRKGRLVGLLCECGQKDCRASLAVAPGEYEAIRDDPNHRLVAVGHSRQNERVVVRTDRYLIVKPTMPPSLTETD